MITTDAPSPPDFLISLAHRMAETSGRILRRYFRTPMTVDRKIDSSPVTIADRETERALRELVYRTVPTHGIIGEEYGEENTSAEWVWVLDPIDGTKAFMTGKPSFSTLIGLAWRGLPVFGIIDQPITGERWIGGRGIPAQLNGQPIRVRLCDLLAKACLYATDPDMFCHSTASHAVWQRLEKAVALRRFGADSYAYGLLAAGFIDIVYECQLQVYDHLPVKAVVEAAGGVVSVVSTGNGTNGPKDRFASNVCVLASGDQRVHESALALLQTVQTEDP